MTPWRHFELFCLSSLIVVLLSYKQYPCFFNEKASIAIFEYNIFCLFAFYTWEKKVVNRANFCSSQHRHGSPSRNWVILARLRSLPKLRMLRYFRDNPFTLLQPAIICFTIDPLLLLCRAWIILTKYWPRRMVSFYQEETLELIFHQRRLSMSSNFFFAVHLTYFRYVSFWGA